MNAVTTSALDATLFAARARWVVEVTLATRLPLDDRTLDALADEADRRDATVARRAGGPGVVVIVEVVSTEVGQVPGWARSLVEAVDETGAELVDLRVCAPELHAAEAARPDTPELLAATDVAALLGVSRQRVHQLAAEHPDFPAPYVRLGSGPIWTRPTIDHFDRHWRRKPGRPARRAG